jgi:hypothetical protein
VANWMGLLDPTTAGGMQGAGLFSGLSALGAGLMNAGQMRPMGQPGPTVADAFSAFGQGRQQGLMGAYQNSEMAKRQAKAQAYENARSSKPDAELSPQELAMRQAFGALPQGVQAFADADTMPGLVIDRETKRRRQLTPEEMQAGGYRPGSVVYTSDWDGMPNVVQAPDYKSPEAEAQALRISAAGRAAPAPIILGPGQTAYGRDGKPIATGGPDGQPLSPANAWNDILRYAGDVAAGKIDVNSPQGQRYLAAQTILTRPVPQMVTGPDGAQYRVDVQPEFPFPRLSMPGAAPPTQPAQGGQPPAAPTAAPGAVPPPVAPSAPAQVVTPPVAPAAAAPGVPPGAMPVKPPAGLTEAQGKANMFGMAMAEGHRIISEVGTPSSAAIIAWRNLPETGVNPMLPAKDQQYFNALRQFAAGVLRKETGAAFAPSELLDVQSRFFPMPGDDQKTKDQKARARTQAIEAMRAEIPGGFRGQIEPPPAPPPAAPRRETDRKANTVYDTPRGPLKWTGTGWVPAQ